jgi:hypothetical protein
LGLKTNRADAKLIHGHVQKYIDNAKEHLKKFDVDLGSTDEDALNALE